MEKGKVAFHTLGCKVNQYETNGMIQKFIQAGYAIVPFTEIADIYIINTCTVTNMSDRKTRQYFRRAKKTNPKAIVVAVGCYVQVKKEKLQEIPEIDLILGTNEKSNIVAYVEQYLNQKSKNRVITDVMKEKEFSEFGDVTYTENARATIKIQDGCDRFCTYCIIPYARGRIRSRKQESIIEEIQELAQNGIKEVVITGIHIASYGKDWNEKDALIELLEKINNIKGIERIRLGSLEPTLITEEWVKRLKKLDKICDHFHLSMQSGCDETLKRMNRRYTVENMLQSIKLLREEYPEVALTTDIIVGFPGETEEEFQKTYDILQKIKFYKIHVFPYSRREGTKAAQMENQIPEKIKQERSKILIQLSNQEEEKFLKKYIGKKVKVLWEEKIDDWIQGHTTNYMVVKQKSEELKNEIEEVLVSSEEKLELISKM